VSRGRRYLYVPAFRGLNLTTRGIFSRTKYIRTSAVDPPVNHVKILNTPTRRVGRFDGGG